jgi:hypothetical protein
MNWSDISFNPSKRTLRAFAGLWIIVFGTMAVWQTAVEERRIVGAALGFLTVVVGVLGLAAPERIRRLYVCWMIAAFPIGWTVSKAILGLLLYGVFTPIGALSRLFGRDPLALRKRADSHSYWLLKEHPSDLRRYFRQY